MLFPPKNIVNHKDQKRSPDPTNTIEYLTAQFHLLHNEDSRREYTKIFKGIDYDDYEREGESYEDFQLSYEPSCQLIEVDMTYTEFMLATLPFEIVGD